jgi:hypothetical protein
MVLLLNVTKLLLDSAIIGPFKVTAPDKITTVAPFVTLKEQAVILSEVSKVLSITADVEAVGALGDQLPFQVTISLSVTATVAALTAQGEDP